MNNMKPSERLTAIAPEVEFLPEHTYFDDSMPGKPSVCILGAIVYQLRRQGELVNLHVMPYGTLSQIHPELLRPVPHPITSEVETIMQIMEDLFENYLWDWKDIQDWMVKRGV